MDIIKNIQEVGKLYLNDVRVLVNQLCEGHEAWELILATLLTVLAAGWIRQELFLHELGLFTRAKLFIFRTVRSLPVIGQKIQEELDKTKANFTKDLFPLTPGDAYTTCLPDKGMSRDAVLALAQSKYKSMEKIDWQGGRLSGAVYNCGEEHDKFMAKIFNLFVGDNLLHPGVFRGPRKMEVEVIAMCCEFFHGGPDACGTMTSGGTESILMACKAYRERAYERGIKTPEMYAHAAFTKAAKYFKMRFVGVPLDPQTLQVDLREMKKRINKRTCMLVASAPGFPHGVIDQVEEIGQLGKRYDIPVHVDACMGGFVLPFAKEAGLNVPSMDFAVEGVTSISADVHKYGQAPKGSSVILYRNAGYRSRQFYINTDWCGGIYASGAIQGTRSGAIIATCWATMLALGREGYMESAVKVIQTREYIEKHIRDIPGLFICGKPSASILAMGSKSFDINRLGSSMAKRGWHLFTVQYPAGVNFVVTKMHTVPGVADTFLSDLKECTAELMKDPLTKAEGIAAMYGMAESIPDRSMVEEFVHGYLEAYYSTNKA
ncbi:sphingosine-1-phosphate lyase 1-like [Acanthaster planci]|uniref:sphinganine-1-phosphate aldolase n=1 Tax=Acanthaster planci TaxID=133434 RepID=A0A8B7YLV4_ACAPL|nr:sphingosine-1-phosphate lyase 1-like [Acanthaster planci]